MRAIMVLGLVSLMLAGCGSSPKTHFYALTVVTGSRTSKASPTWPVQIAAVHVPPSLDRQQMVKRTVGNSVDISDQNRWAAPLSTACSTCCRAATHRTNSRSFAHA